MDLTTSFTVQSALGTATTMKVILVLAVVAAIAVVVHSAGCPDWKKTKRVPLSKLEARGLRCMEDCEGEVEALGRINLIPGEVNIKSKNFCIRPYPEAMGDVMLED